MIKEQVDKKQKEAWNSAKATLEKALAENRLAGLSEELEPEVLLFFAQVACSLSQTIKPMSNLDRAQYTSFYFKNKSGN